MRCIFATFVILAILTPSGDLFVVPTIAANQKQTYFDPLLARPTVAQKARGHQPSHKGIHVGQPKVFDDRSLQLMLSAAELRLATLQAIDQARTTANIGAVQGGSQVESGLAVQVASAPTPSIVTTNGANNSLTSGVTNSLSGGTTGSNGVTVVTGSSPSTTSTTNNGTTTTNSTTGNVSNTTATNASTQTTTPSVSPMLVPAPAQSGLSLPTNVAVSASDVLNEEMQLTFQIANLRLLLEGSLNDRFVTGNQRLKQHATVGFPISIEAPPDSRYKNAVAEVRVTITTWPNFYDKQQQPRSYEDVVGAYQSGPTANTGPVCPAYAATTFSDKEGLYSDQTCPDAPGLMAILPREKTYNVVDIKANSISLSGAATASVLTAGVTWYRATKHFYVIQAQDTVAFEDEPHLRPNGGRLNSVSTTFGWQFRPVLNESRVRPGLRQLFAELSFPTLPPTNGQLEFYGTVTVEARWRHYDPKTASVGSAIIDPQFEREELCRIQGICSAAPKADSPSVEWIGAWQLPNFDLTPKVPEGISWEEAGPGAITVAANGFYTPGTGIVVGSSLYSPATGNYYYDPDKIRFVAPSADLVRVDSILLEEQGGAQRSLDRDPMALGAFAPMEITEATAVPLSNSDMILNVCYTGGVELQVNDKMTRPLALLAGKVYGLSDQPYVPLTKNPCSDSNNAFIAFRAPADTVRSARRIRIKQLFDGPTAIAEHEIAIINDFSAAKAVTVAAANSCTLLAVQGSQLLFKPLASGATDPVVHVRIGDQEIPTIDPTNKERCSFLPEGNQNTQSTVSKSPPKPSVCSIKKAYVDTTLGLTTLLVAAPDCLLKSVKQIEIYRGDSNSSSDRVQTVLLSVTEEKVATAQIDTLEVQVGTKTVRVKGTHLELIDLTSLYFTGFVGTSLNPKFASDTSYIELTLPDALNSKTGNYALNFTQQDKDKTPGGSLVRIVKPKTQ
jgi:hypothetical protein